MNFLEIAKKRYSVRSYNNKKVEKEKLDMILEAGRVAPTGANFQPQYFIVVQQQEGLEKIQKAGKTFGAPCVIIVCCDTKKTWVRSIDGKKLTDIDATIVTDHMMLQATELGLGTVWVCSFKPDVIKEEFGLPQNLEPINLLIVGYSDEVPQSPDRHETKRKPLSEMVSYEKL